MDQNSGGVKWTQMELFDIIVTPTKDWNHYGSKN